MQMVMVLTIAMHGGMSNGCGNGDVGFGGHDSFGNIGDGGNCTCVLVSSSSQIL